MLTVCWSVKVASGRFVAVPAVDVTTFVRTLSVRVKLSSVRLLSCLITAWLSLSKFSDALVNDSLDVDSSWSFCQCRNDGLPHVEQNSNFCCLVWCVLHLQKSLVI